MNPEQQTEQQTETLPMKPGAGRKPKENSRATELRQALIEWKQIPEGSRMSLRCLATQLRTSHQLLAHYLEGLDDWYERRHYEARKRQALERAQQIEATVAREGRHMNMSEAHDSVLVPAFLDQIEEMRQDFRRGPLSSHQKAMLKIYAQMRPEAQNLLHKCQQDQRPRRRPKPLQVRKITEAQFHQIRLQKLVERFEEIGGVLLLEERQVHYFVPEESALSRALVSELVNYREELKRILELNPGKVDFGNVKAEICQRFPAVSLSPLEPQST